MTLSEFDVIRHFFTHPAPGALLGVGDDAAIVRARRGTDLVISTDMLVAGRHFAADADPAALGHKALAVNLSDMAAMGATPRWVTLSLALPRADARWLGAFSRGFLQLARRHGVDLVGGDTTRGPLNIAVQIVGEVPSGGALRRDGARPADDVWVSGTLGDAALALAARGGRIRVTRADRAYLERRLHRPEPRIGLGQALRGLAHSAIDVSDGLVADLGHICERSGVRAEIRLELLPASAAVRRRRALPGTRAAMLSGGDDYELLFTAAPRWRRAIARLARRVRVPLARIGTILPLARRAAAVTVLDRAGAPIVLRRGGYRHFG